MLFRSGERRRSVWHGCLFVGEGCREESTGQLRITRSDGMVGVVGSSGVRYSVLGYGQARQE